LREHVERLRQLLGRGKVYDDPEVVSLYSREASGLEASELPLAVVFAESSEDVSRLLSYAYKWDVKVYPQGSATSISGSSVAGSDGVVLSLERMRRIKEISVIDSIAVVEPGVRIDDLNVELASYGYMFPVDPASSAAATVGGAINTGAGGLKGAKYGTMRDWVLGLEVVIPDEHGTVMRLGCRTVKCRQGYDLVRLIVGSEGTLAVVTEAILRIAPLPEADPTVLAFFSRLEELVDAVVAVKESGWQPLLMEFMDDRTVSLASSYVPVSVRAEGHMLLVSIETSREAIDRVLDQLEDLMRKAGAKTLYRARSLREAEAKGLLALRRSLYPAQVEAAKRAYGPNARAWLGDIAVPPSRLIDAIEGLRELESKYGFTMMLGGHIGDGNLHPSVGFNPDDARQVRKVAEWYHEVMRLAIKLGGTVSAEHGIGLLKKRGLAEELEALGSAKALDIMRGIKRLFDPKNILNPGKVI
jgi:glycolate oxidase